MCLILDASKYGEFLDLNNEDMKPVRTWIGKNGKIVHSPTEKLKKELNKSSRMRTWIDARRGTDKVKIIDTGKVKKEERKLTGLVSDDPHIIALAIASNTKLLVSGDKNLHTDFKEKTGGSIYKKKDHKHLLGPDTCP